MFCQFLKKCYLCTRNSAEVLVKAFDKGPRGGMVDALVSGASVERRASSTLVVGTFQIA